MLKATYDPQGKAQDIFAYADSKADAKISKVSSPTAGNIPILTADGQIADSGKNAEEVGGSDLPEVTESDAGKTLVVGSDGNWGAGEVAGNVFIAKYGVTTAEELEAAYQAGKAIFVTGMTAVECEIDFGEVLPLTNREAEYIFVFQGCDNSARKFSCACTPDSPAWGGGVLNGAFFGILFEMVDCYTKAGCDFSECTEDQDYLDVIEAFEDERNTPSDEVDAQTEALESIAAQLEYQNMLSTEVE